jgi:tRNA A-37 threonylcarbamoyl transferase component Bud32
MGRQERPVTPGPLYEFARDLRQLRVGAGGPPYRLLARKAGYCASALSAAAAGDLLPSLEVTLAYVGSVGGDQQMWRRRWTDLAARLRRTNPGLLAPDAVPADLSEPDQDANPAAARSPLSPSDPRQVGPYQLLGRLGSGSMGRVYLGRDRSGALAAVKVVRPDLADDPTFRRRFARELRIIGNVSSPRIAAPLAADMDAEQPWLATAYTPGSCLQDVVDRDGPLPPEAVRQLAAGIADGLVVLHAAGIVHRDLKPSNLLLAADGPRIIDFGIARALDGTHLTATGAHLGSAAFMSPEQALGKAAGPPADIFALGALITFALTGHPPFGEGTPETVLYRIVHTDPDLDAAGGKDPDLGALAGRCLHKDPAQRPPADLVRGQLDAATRGRPARQAEPGTPTPGDLGVAARNAKPARPFARARLAVAPMILLAAIITTLTILNTGAHGLPELGPDPATSPTLGTTAPVTASAAPRTQISAGPTVGLDGTPGANTNDTRPATGTGARTQTVKFGFDDGTTQSWGPFWNGANITATVTSQTVYSGSYALRLQANTHYDRPPAIGTTHVNGLTAGTTVTFHLWYGGQGSGSILPFVQDNAGVQWAPQTFALPATTGWRTFTWTVPNTTPHALGIQFNTTNTADAVVALDSVNWA